jgi:ferrous iron transport protein B
MKETHKQIAIIGAPNVGKSSIFNNLSTRYATVSNYPGTTVELFKAKIKIKGTEYGVIDAPGMHSLLPLSEEERIARFILIKDDPAVVLHVGAAKNLERTLPLTLQLIEAGFPVILVLNIMDEARKEGMTIDIEKLSKILGVSVVPTISVRNKGIENLKEKINALSVRNNRKIITYPDIIEKGIKEISASLKHEYTLSKRALSLLLLQADEDVWNLVEEKEDTGKITQIKKSIESKVSQPIEYMVNLVLKENVEEIVRETAKLEKKKERNFSAVLSDLTLNPFFGIPMLALFLYFGIYKLVGQIGAGVLVDLLEGVFEQRVNPLFISIFEKIIPYEPINSLFVGEYGIITLGIRYAVAIILPIVGIFFFVFSFAEDTGYLPRIGAMLDRLFKKIGLSGRAVIPMILGLGCDTMATMVTRILPTKRERIIATFLLSLSVPCSAQLGVIMAVLSKRQWALLVWFFVITSVFTVSGFLLNKVVKGRHSFFYMELPPLRMPRLSNIIVKTYTRLKWYFKEVLPLFIWASVLIWLGQVIKVFNVIISFLAYPLRLIGLPESLSRIFLFGFFRRDYGAAGLYDLDKQGFLTLREVIVAAVVLTLFLPCIAQLLMNIKERGMKLALSIMLFVLIFAFGVGFLLNKILLIAGVS